MENISFGYLVDPSLLMLIENSKHTYFQAYAAS